MKWVDLEGMVGKMIPEDFWGRVMHFRGRFRKLWSGFCFVFSLYVSFTASGSASFVVLLCVFSFSSFSCVFLCCDFYY